MRLWLGLLLLAAACAPLPPASSPRALDLVDPARGRAVPVRLRGPVRRPLVLISHGYGGTHSDHDFIAAALAARGYLVASVQHQLPFDPAMPTTGEPAVVRRPFWEAGVANLLFVADALAARGLTRRGEPLILIGHSNGGDASMLLASLHPGRVRAVISLDNRRMALPRTRRPRICSARSSDFPADPGVLPGAAEQLRLGMLIQPVPVRHDEMTDAASDAQKAAMLALIFNCLDPVAQE